MADAISKRKNRRVSRSSVTIHFYLCIWKFYRHSSPAKRADGSAALPQTVQHLELLLPLSLIATPSSKNKLFFSWIILRNVLRFMTGLYEPRRIFWKFFPTCTSHSHARCSALPVSLPLYNSTARSVFPLKHLQHALLSLLCSLLQMPFPRVTLWKDPLLRLLAQLLGNYSASLTFLP